jgi:hypothetical protein
LPVVRLARVRNPCPVDIIERFILWGSHPQLREVRELRNLSALDALHLLDLGQYELDILYSRIERVLRDAGTPVVVDQCGGDESGLLRRMVNSQGMGRGQLAVLPAWVLCPRNGTCGQTNHPHLSSMARGAGLRVRQIGRGVAAVVYEIESVEPRGGGSGAGAPFVSSGEG